MDDASAVYSLQAAPTILVIREGPWGHTALFLLLRQLGFFLDPNCMEDAFRDGFLGIDLNFVMFLHLVHGGAPVYTLLLLFFVGGGDGAGALLDTEDL